MSPPEDLPSLNSGRRPICSCVSCLSGRKLLTSAINSLYPMGPYRLPPERWYIFAGTSLETLAIAGQFLPTCCFASPTWSSRPTFGWIGSELATTSRRGNWSLNPKIFLNSDWLTASERRGRHVRRGFGISQLLPFVVQCLASKGQIITIEQPEVHVHPRLQADIGDLLIDSIQEPRKHQFIVETHSEHLILRLQRRSASAC